MNLFDFDKYEQNDEKFYGGTAGIKIGVTINGEDWMIKYPGKLKDAGMKNVELSYSTTPISEYIGCKIFQSIGIDTQEVMLGSRNNKVVVACKDFLPNGITPIYYKDIKATFEPTITNPRGDTTNGTGVLIDSIIRTFDEHPFLLKHPEGEERFWQMFVVDAFIGNVDRNNENWGFMRNAEGDISLMPVYDCGNCLNSKMSERQMAEALNNKDKLIEISIKRPCIYERKEGKRINPFTYMSNSNRSVLKKAISEIVPKINLKTIKGIVSDIPTISEIQKSFYDSILTERYWSGLVPVHNQILEGVIKNVDINKNGVGSSLKQIDEIREKMIKKPTHNHIIQDKNK